MGDDIGSEDDRTFEQDICMTALMREYAGNFSTRRIERVGDAVHITTMRDSINDQPAREIIVHVTVTITEAEE
jgi:hypothetical protein